MRYAMPAALALSIALAAPASAQKPSTADREGVRRAAAGDAPRDVIVGEVNDQTATAKVVAWWGIDYLQLARYDGKWMIVNVMWQSPPK